MDPRLSFNFPTRLGSWMSPGDPYGSLQHYYPMKSLFRLLYSALQVKRLKFWVWTHGGIAALFAENIYFMSIGSF